MAGKAKTTQWYKIILKDKLVLGLSIGLLIVSLIFIAFSLFQIKPAELRIMSRYNGFSSPYYYRNEWYYLFGWPILAVIIGVINNAIGIKLLVKRQKPASILVLSLSIFILFLMFFVFSRIINLPR